jgi:hypothetical protein
MSLHFVVQFTMSDEVTRLHECFIVCDIKYFEEFLNNFLAIKIKSV